MSQRGHGNGEGRRYSSCISTGACARERVSPRSYASCKVIPIQRVGRTPRKGLAAKETLENKSKDPAAPREPVPPPSRSCVRPSASIRPSASVQPLKYRRGGRRHYPVGRPGTAQCRSAATFPRPHVMSLRKRARRKNQRHPFARRKRATCGDADDEMP